MTTMRTGTSSTVVLAFETASDSMSKDRPFTEGERSFSASRPVVLHASMAGSLGLCALVGVASTSVRSERQHVNARIDYSYYCTAFDVSHRAAGQRTGRFRSSSEAL